MLFLLAMTAGNPYGNDDVFKNELSRLRLSQDTDQRKIAEMHEMLKGYKDAYDASVAKNTIYEIELRQVKTQLAQTQAALFEKKDDTALQKQVEDLSAKLIEREDALKTAKAENAKFKQIQDAIKKTNETIALLRQEKQELEEQLFSLQNEKTVDKTQPLRAQIGTLKAEIETLKNAQKTAAESHKNEKASKQKQLDDQVKAIETRNKKIKELEDTIADYENTKVIPLTAMIDQLKKEIKTLKDDINTKDTALKKYRKKNAISIVIDPKDKDLFQKGQMLRVLMQCKKNAAYDNAKYYGYLAAKMFPYYFLGMIGTHMHTQLYNAKLVENLFHTPYSRELSTVLNAAIAFMICNGEKLVWKQYTTLVDRCVCLSLFVVYIAIGYNVYFDFMLPYLLHLTKE